MSSPLACHIVESHTPKSLSGVVTASHANQSRFIIMNLVKVRNAESVTAGLQNLPSHRPDAPLPEGLKRVPGVRRLGRNTWQRAIRRSEAEYDNIDDGIWLRTKTIISFGFTNEKNKTVLWINCSSVLFILWQKNYQVGFVYYFMDMHQSPVFSKWITISYIHWSYCLQYPADDQTKGLQ